MNDAAAGSLLQSLLEAQVIEVLRGIQDPELPVNIYDLGLIYKLDVDAQQGTVHIEMTLTAPGCPVAQTFPGMVECAVRDVPGINTACVELVWDPPWDRDRMTADARLLLDMF